MFERNTHPKAFICFHGDKPELRYYANIHSDGQEVLIPECWHFPISPHQDASTQDIHIVTKL